MKKEVEKKKESNKKMVLKFKPINLIIILLIIAISTILCYHFFGIIEAGIVGIEPTNGRFKAVCVTTSPYPYL